MPGHVCNFITRLFLSFIGGGKVDEDESKSLAHAVLSAWWSIEDNTNGESALQFAELLAELK
jgi:hypothetical protein